MPKTMKQMSAFVMFVVGMAGVPITASAASPVAINAEDDVSYALKKGESLYSIGQNYLSGGSAYIKVQRYNRVANPFKIAPGTVIAIPRQYLKVKLLEAQIISFRGNATLELGGVQKKPVVGTTVTEGTILQTADDGFMTIGMTDGSHVTLPSKSRIKVLHLRQILLTGTIDFDFQLDQGRAEAVVTPLKAKDDRFRLRTPIAVSAVRGTRFRVAYDGVERPSLTEVTQGGVGVASTSAGTKTDPSLIPAGYGAIAKASGDVGKEALLAAPAVLSPGKVQKEPTVQIALAAIPTAAGYHVQLAQDAGFVDIVAAKRSETPSAEFDNVADGTYFVRAMAIAPSGLEGLSETYSLRRALTVVGGSAAPLEPGTYQFKWLGQGAGKHSFRFQLLREPKDVTAMVDEVGLEDTSLTLKGLAPGTYFWRVSVRQFSSAGITESWTPPEKIIVSALEK